MIAVVEGNAPVVEELKELARDSREMNFKSVRFMLDMLQVIWIIDAGVVWYVWREMRSMQREPYYVLMFRNCRLTF